MATAAASDAAPSGGGKKKLMIIVVAVLVLALLGVTALLLLKKKPAEDEDGAAEQAPAAASYAAPKPGTPPVFVPLEPFTVNLADKDVDRFAQIGITLEVGDAKFAEQLKLYMPAIRSNVLMVLSHKTSVELLTLEGKEKLARDIMRESLRPMGIEIDDDDEDTPRKKRSKRRNVVSPITNVLFSSFIVQ